MSNPDTGGTSSPAHIERLSTISGLVRERLVLLAGGHWCVYQATTSHPSQLTKEREGDLLILRTKERWSWTCTEQRLWLDSPYRAQATAPPSTRKSATSGRAAYTTRPPPAAVPAGPHHQQTTTSSTISSTSTTSSSTRRHRTPKPGPELLLLQLLLQQPPRPQQLAPPFPQHV